MPFQNDTGIPVCNLLVVVSHVQKNTVVFILLLAKSNNILRRSRDLLIPIFMEFRPTFKMVTQIRYENKGGKGSERDAHLCNTYPFLMA